DSLPPHSGAQGAADAASGPQHPPEATAARPGEARPHLSPRAPGGAAARPAARQLRDAGAGGGPEGASAAGRDGGDRAAAGAGAVAAVAAPAGKRGAAAAGGGAGHARRARRAGDPGGPGAGHPVRGAGRLIRAGAGWVIIETFPAIARSRRTVGGGDGCAPGVVPGRDRTDRRGATSENPQLRPPHQPAAPARLSLTFLRTARFEAKASPGPLSSWEGGGRTQQIPGGDAAPEDLARPLAGAILVALTVPSPPALTGAGRGLSLNPATATARAAITRAGSRPAPGRERW